MIKNLLLINQSLLSKSLLLTKGLLSSKALGLLLLLLPKSLLLLLLLLLITHINLDILATHIHVLPSHVQTDSKSNLVGINCLGLLLLLLLILIILAILGNASKHATQTLLHLW